MNIPKRHKYGARRKSSSLTGRSFASSAEARRGDQLKMMEMAGAISDLGFQPAVVLSAAGIVYRPDFSYTENGQAIWEDVKGAETPVFRLKAKLWEAYGPGPLRIVKVERKWFRVERTVVPVAAQKTSADFDGVRQPEPK